MTMHAQMRGGSVYAGTARFDTGRALSEDELFKLAPSVFAVAPHESRSERFVAIPTIDAVRALAREGFSVVGAKQSLCRVEGRADFTKHALRLRRLDDDVKHSVGDTVFEMLLKNANDGSSAYDLLAALWRVRCLNSLVAKVADVDSVKVRHTGKRVVDDVIEGTYRVIADAEKALAAPQDWGRMKLEREEAAALAKAAHVLRFADAKGTIRTPVEPDQLLRARRAEDRQNDLWTVWNTVQEHCIKGGDTATRFDEKGKPRAYTSRPIKGIDQDVRLNAALWTLGEEMARLKGGRAAA